MRSVSQCAGSLVFAAVLTATGGATFAATCDQTKTISVPWTVQVAPELQTSTGAGFVDSASVAGAPSTAQAYDVNLLHTAPTQICGGPTPDLPTSVDLSALVEWGGVWGVNSTASSATASLDMTIAGQAVPFADQILSGDNALSRFFVETSNFDFTVNVDSSFSVDGTVAIENVTKDNLFQVALTVQGLRVTLDPFETTGFVEYLVPIPVPATAVLFVSALSMLGVARLRDRRRDI